MKAKQFKSLISSRKQTLQPSGITEPTKQYEETEWFIEIKKLRNGEYFGELALITDKPRAATITCLEKSSFAVIDKIAYKNVLIKIDEKKKLHIDQFLSSLPFFAGWKRKEMHKLHLLFEQRQYRYN